MLVKASSFIGIPDPNLDLDPSSDPGADYDFGSHQNRIHYTDFYAFRDLYPADFLGISEANTVKITHKDN